MNKLIFLLIGLSIALFTEFWRFALIAEDAAPDLLGWILIVVSYIVILTIALHLTKKIKSSIVFYILFGISGILIETFVLGTNPLAHIVILLWVFSFWGTIALMPMLYLENELKKQTVVFFVLALTSSLLMFSITKASFLLAVFFISLNIPYFIWQFRR